MTPAEARSRLIAMGCSPEAAARAEIGGEGEVETSKFSKTEMSSVVSIPPSCWTIRIPGWHPPSLNRIMAGHWSNGAKLKKTTTAIVALYVRRAGIPKAETKRRVTLHLVLAPKQRAGDPDGCWKALLDALVHAGALRDDNRKWVDCEPVSFSRGDEKATYITVEDCE